MPTFPLLIYNPVGIPYAVKAEQQPLAKYLPRNLRQIWEQGRSQGLGGGINAVNIPDYYAGFFALQSHLQKKYFAAVQGMNEVGVPIMAGTDATAPGVFPGFGLHSDLEFLVHAGLTPMQALQAATLKPAEFLGRSKELGTIQAGKRADLVLIDANPLESISNTRKIEAVIVNGRVLLRSDLDALLTTVERFAATH